MNTSAPLLHCRFKPSAALNQLYIGLLLALALYAGLGLLAGFWSMLFCGVIGLLAWLGPRPQSAPAALRVQGDNWQLQSQPNAEWQAAELLEVRLTRWHIGLRLQTAQAKQDFILLADHFDHPDQHLALRRICLTAARRSALTKAVADDILRP